MRGISWLAANQLASQEGLCTMEKVSMAFGFPFHKSCTALCADLLYKVSAKSDTQFGKNGPMFIKMPKYSMPADTRVLKKTHAC